MEKRKPKTAREAIDELEASPEFVAARARREAEREKLASAYRVAEAPLVAAVRAAGARVDSVWDLVNTSAPYPELLPILAAHLSQAHPDRVREGIARALAVRDSRAFWPELLRHFETAPDDAGLGAKFALSVALAACADGSVLEDVVRLALDRSHGVDRVMFLQALSRIGASSRNPPSDHLPLMLTSAPRPSASCGVAASAAVSGRPDLRDIRRAGFAS